MFDGKDGKHLKLLLKKIKTKVEEKGIEATDENILTSLKMFFNSLKDQWILDNLEIAIVNSKFNSLYAKAVRNNPFNRAEQLAESIRRKHSPNSERAA